MRVVLAGVALACIAGAVLAALGGDWGSAAAWSFGFWTSAGWWVAMMAANAKVDEILDEVRQDEEEER